MRNVYREFLSLLPARPLQVATVIAISGEAATVELPGGGLLQVRGVAAVDDVVFVRDGVIEGQAPSLPVEVIDI